jgi:hypothetical protein
LPGCVWRTHPGPAGRPSSTRTPGTSRSPVATAASPGDDRGRVSPESPEESRAIQTRPRRAGTGGSKQSNLAEPVRRTRPHCERVAAGPRLTQPVATELMIGPDLPCDPPQQGINPTRRMLRRMVGVERDAHSTIPLPSRKGRGPWSLVHPRRGLPAPTFAPRPCHPDAACHSERHRERTKNVEVSRVESITSGNRWLLGDADP